MTKSNTNFITTLKTALIASTEITMEEKEYFVFRLLANSLSDDELECVEELKIFSTVKKLSNLPLALYGFVMRNMDAGAFNSEDVKIRLVLEMFNTVNWVSGHETNAMALRLCGILGRFADFVKSERDTW